MLGSLLRTTVEARARREVLLAEASVQRQRMTGYLDAFDPATRWIDRLISALRFLLDRPAIPAGVVVALVIFKPRKVLAVATFAWKAISWIRRFKSVVP